MATSKIEQSANSLIQSRFGDKFCAKAAYIGSDGTATFTLNLTSGAATFVAFAIFGDKYGIINGGIKTQNNAIQRADNSTAITSYSNGVLTVTGLGSNERILCIYYKN